MTSKAVDSLIHFYNRLNSERQLNQDEKVAVSIRHGLSQLSRLEDGLNALSTEQNGFKEAYYQMIEDAKKNLNVLLQKEGSLQLAFFGDDMKSPLLQEILDITLDGPDFCSNMRYQFKGISRNDIELKWDDHPVKSKDDFEAYITEQKIHYEAEKEVLKEQWEAFQVSFKEEASFLKKVEDDYKKRLEDYTIKCDILRIFLNREWLVTYSFTDIKNDMSPKDLSYDYDGLVYVFDRKQLYYQKNYDVIEALKIKPGIGIVITEENEDLREEVQKQFDHMFKEVMVLNPEDFSVEAIIHAFDQVFDQDYESIKLRSKKINFERVLNQFKADSRDLTQHLIKTYNQLALLRSELKTNIDKEYHQLRSKVLWVINNYEMQVKLGLEEQVKQLLTEQSQISSKDFYDEIMFKERFITDLNRLHSNLKKMVIRFYEKNRADFDEDYSYFDQMSHEERIYKENPLLKNAVVFKETAIVNLMNQFNNKMIFTRKKKMSNIQEEVLAYLEETTENIKKLYFDEIEMNIKVMHEDLYKKFEDAFEKKYCNMDEVNKIVRFVDDEVKKISIELQSLTIKDMIIAR